MQRAAELKIGQKPRALTSSTVPVHDFPGFEHVRVSTLHTRGSVLFAEGQFARGVYLLRVGSVKLSISSEQGKVLVFHIARAGELLGVNSVLRQLPYEATAETLEACRTDFIPHSDFVGMCSNNKEVGESVLEALSRHLYEMTEIARMLLLSETAAEKLARLLLKWGDDHGVEMPYGICVDNSFTQEEISQMICTSRETVTRLFGMFGKRDLVHLNGDTIVIRDRKGLESVSEFNKNLLTAI